MTPMLDWRDPAELQAMRLLAPIVNVAGERSGDKLRSIIEQFDVENSPRYRRSTRGGGTWCNRLVCDVMDAMGVVLPYLRASDILMWLGHEGAQHGWRSVSAKVSMFDAAQGRPTVVGWINPSAVLPGHIAVVAPYRGPGLWIAQAGATNFSFGLEQRGFGRLGPLRYFTHD